MNPATPYPAPTVPSRLRWPSPQLRFRRPFLQLQFREQFLQLQFLPFRFQPFRFLPFRFQPLQFLPLLLACSSPSAPGSRAVLLVHSGLDSYDLAGKAVPVFTMRHDGGPDVVISGCPSAPSAILERQDAAGWSSEASRGVVCPAIYQVQVDTLTKGETKQFTLAPWREGRYRVRVLIGAYAAAPERTILSNEFDVH